MSDDNVLTAVEGVAVEETVEEVAVEETVEEVAVEETVEEVAAEETVEEAAVKETIEEAAFEENFDPMAVQEEYEDDVQSLEEDEYDNLNLAPLRVQAAKPARRHTSNFSPLQTKKNKLKRNSLDSATLIPSLARNRSKSPSYRLRDKGHSSMGDILGMDRSIGSLEDFVDPDILYDTKGFSEVDLAEQKESNLSKSCSNLTIVSERLCEDTLEDVHAFSDLTVNSNTRASSSVGGSTANGDVGSHVLAPLNECEDEDDYLSDQDETGEGQIILTNMENLTILENEPLSLTKDAPSIPTDAETLPISVQTDAKTPSVK